MMPVDPICLKCKHFNEFGIGCRAFPDGIPQQILDSNQHDKPLPNQGNNIVYEKKQSNETDRST